MPDDPSHLETESPESRARDGIVSAAIAFFLWGAFPLYFIVVKDVSANEVLAHRIIWAAPFGALIIHLRHQWTAVILFSVDAWLTNRTLARVNG